MFPFFIQNHVCPLLAYLSFKIMGRGAGSEGNSILSILALEILLYFNWWFSLLYICANIVVFAYKGACFCSNIPGARGLGACSLVNGVIVGRSLSSSLLSRSATAVVFLVTLRSARCDCRILISFKCCAESGLQILPVLVAFPRFAHPYTLNV